MNLLCAPGFLDDFQTLPTAVQAEVKENYRIDAIGKLHDGRFSARLRGKQLDALAGYECLAGKMKMYLQGNQYRLVFEQSGNTVLFLAAGPRADMLVYKRARDRFNTLYP